MYYESFLIPIIPEKSIKDLKDLKDFFTYYESFLILKILDKKQGMYCFSCALNPLKSLKSLIFIQLFPD